MGPAGLAEGRSPCARRARCGAVRGWISVRCTGAGDAWNPGPAGARRHCLRRVVRGCRGLGVILIRTVQNQAQALFAPSCVTRHRARSKFLDQDTDRSDASRRVNSLIFTLGAPAGDRSRPPGGPGAMPLRRNTPPRRPLQPGVTRFCCRWACLGLRPGPPVNGRRCLELSRRARLVWTWLPWATCATLSRADLRSSPRRCPHPAVR